MKHMDDYPSLKWLAPDEHPHDFKVPADGRIMLIREVGRYGVVSQCTGIYGEPCLWSEATDKVKCIEAYMLIPKPEGKCKIPHIERTFEIGGIVEPEGK